MTMATGFRQRCGIVPRNAVSAWMSAARVEFQDLQGVPHTLVCTGLLARCIQHEADHLNGVLFIDRMDKKTRAGIEDAVKALAKETRAAAKG